jgi:hypothetical protein
MCLFSVIVLMKRLQQIVHWGQCYITFLNNLQISK